MNLKEFGVYFTKLREQSGYRSQRELADRSGVSHSTINRIESGTHEVSPKNLRILAEYLDGVDYKDLMRAVGYLDDEDLSSTPSESNNADDLKEFEEFINNPNHGIFFKDYLSAPEERKRELLQFWRFIKEAEKGRKPGDRQGE